MHLRSLSGALRGRSDSGDLARKDLEGTSGIEIQRRLEESKAGCGEIEYDERGLLLRV